MKRPQATYGRLAMAFLMALMLIPSVIFSQERITTAILDPIWVVPDTILPIKEANVTSSAEATSIILADILSKLPDSASIAKYETRLITILKELDTLNHAIAKYADKEIGSKALQNFKNELILLAVDKEKLKNELKETTDRLEEYNEKITFIERTWEVTLASARAGTISGALSERIQQVNREVKASNTKGNNKVEAVISMSDRLLTGAQLMDELLGRVTEAEEQFHLKYLTKSHPAIWERVTMPADGAIKVRTIFTTVKQAYGKGLSQFYGIYSSRIYLHLAILLLILMLAFIIKRNLKRRHIETDDPRKQTFLKVFMRPVSMSFLLALLLVYFIYPNAQMVIRDLASFIILIPLILVARKVLPLKWHTLLYVTSGLFILNELIETAKFESYPLPRVMILIISLSAMTYVTWMIAGRIRKAKQNNHLKFAWIDLFMWLVMTLMAISIIANITGYVSFSFFLFRGMVISAMAGLLLNVTVTVIDGLFTLLIMGRSSQMYERLREYGDKLLNNIVKVVKLFALIYWIVIVLRRFLICDPVLGWLNGILDTKWVINEVTISIEGILLFWLIIFLTIWFSRLIILLLEKEIFPRFKFSRGVPGIISLIFRFTIITAGFILSLGVLGINLDKLTILIGALGVGIGFGLQDIINNLISGFILIFGRPIQVGDIVQFGEREGKVMEIGIRSSTIKTYDGSEVIVPNGKLISNELINLTLSDSMLRIEIDIGTDYSTDPQEVIDILVMQAKLHPEVAQNPEAFAIFFGFGDFALKFRLYAYTLEINSRLKIRSELNLAISQAFKEAGIKIPYPIQDLNVNIAEKKDAGNKKADKTKK